MLCFRCGSPVEAGAPECANCGQALEGEGGPEGGEVDALKEQLRRGERAEPSAAAYQVGELIHDRYEVVDVVGSGPLGTVYKAHDTEVDVDVAVKVLAGEYLPDAEAREAFLERVGQLRQVVHNNIVRYFEVAAEGERCFYVTQFLEGLTLRKIIDLRREKGQRFSLTEVEPIILQLAEAFSVTKTHHGGLKPQNVIILPNLLKVTDLALAEALPRDSYLAAQRTDPDTDIYFAPEVKDGASFGPAADVYALAVIIVELLTGDAYAGGDVRVAEIDEEFPAALDEVLQRALAEEPEARYADVEAFSGAFIGLVEGERSEGVEGEKAESDDSGGEGGARPPGSRETLPFGSAVEPASEERPDATLRYGQVRPEDERPTLKLEGGGEDPQSTVDLADGAPKEVTQTLDLDDVEMEEEAAAGRDGEHPEGAQQAEGTQQLSLEDVEFASGATKAPDEEEKERRHGEEVTVPRATADGKPAPSEEKTQQVDPAMIEDIDDDAEETSEIELSGTRESGGEDAAVSGETLSVDRPLSPRPTDEDLRLPRRERGGEQEARARNVLQAFDATEGTGRFEEMIEPADEDSAQEESGVEEEPSGGYRARPIAAAGGPAPQDERPSKTPLLLAIVVGILFGSGVVYLFTRGGEPKVAAPVVVKPTPVVNMDPLPVVEKDAGGPKVTSLAPASSADSRAPVATPMRPDSGPQKDARAEVVKSIPKERSKSEKASRPPQRARNEVKKKKAKVAAVAPKAVKKLAKKTTSPAAKAPAKAKASVGKCSAGMAHVRPRGGGDGYCIDRYEAPGRGRRPRVLSLSGARAACRARGARLCTTREWMKSCGGLFPYGRTFQAGRCNTEGKALAPAGSKRGCRSPYGVYDLSGNVAEWVEEGVAMGGTFTSAQGHASCTARTRGGAATGYRCCADPAWDL